VLLSTNRRLWSRNRAKFISTGLLKLVADTGITDLRHKTRHYPNKSRLRTLDCPWTSPFPLTQCLLFEIATLVNSPLLTQRPSMATPPIYSPPPGKPSTRRHHSGPSFPSRPLSTYSSDTTQRDSTRPHSFPPRPVFSREGTNCSIASSKTGGLHSRTYSVEFLVAHDRSSNASSWPPPPSVPQVQSESFSSRPCFVVPSDPDGEIPRRSVVGRLDKGPDCPSVFAQRTFVQGGRGKNHFTFRAIRRPCLCCGDTR